ncbi:Uncharacterised protein [Klebsiella pneumoniae]|nr:Uncharacterised protein [Klebsiella pneumoniae]
MYDRPNAIKGRYVKIPNMLIFVAEPVNHEVIDPWRLFNITYIMRTKLLILHVLWFGVAMARYTKCQYEHNKLRLTHTSLQ